MSLALHLFDLKKKHPAKKPLAEKKPKPSPNRKKDKEFKIKVVQCAIKYME